MWIWRHKISILLILVLLSGCATLQHPQQPTTLTWQARQAQLKQLNVWEIKGSIGVTYAKHSDIAAFTWAQQQQNYTIDLHSPLNLHSVQITGAPNYVVLRQSDTKEITANNPESLIKREFGWTLPIANLKHWIFAIPAPTQDYMLQFDQVNHLIGLEQQGWTIEYSNFINVNGIELPSKIKMRNQNLQLKLVIKSWKLNSTGL